jgi:hypothetical protein
MLGDLPSLTAGVPGRRLRKSSSGGIIALFERRHQGRHLAADLGCEPTIRPRGLAKLASTPLLTGAGRPVGRRLKASGLALKLSRPLLAGL